MRNPHVTLTGGTPGLDDAPATPAEAMPAEATSPEATLAEVALADRIARRRRLRAALFGEPSRSRGPHRAVPARGEVPGGPAGPPVQDDDADWLSGLPPRAVTGQVLDVSPQVLVIGVGGAGLGEAGAGEAGGGQAEERFALTPEATAWRGAKADPAQIRIGDQVIVRRHGFRREVADRIWANIGRVTGTIVQRDGSALLVDCAQAGRQVVVISERAAGRIQVRFPRLQPGYLIDIIGLRHADHLEGLVPATSQPAYRADHVPAPPLINRRVPGSIRGAATWHDPLSEPAGLMGVAYPAVDPAVAPFPGPAVAPFPGPAGQPSAGPAVVPFPGPAGEPSAEQAGSGCVSLPFLSVGSLLRVRNDCTGRSRLLPVIGPAATARLFCDRSVACGPSPRGRIADLTLASFVELGGELDEGSFNVTIEIGA